MPIYEWKRELELDNIDGTGGIILSLDQVVNGAYDVLYTLPVKVGIANQQFSLEIDTGSSDLWIASTSCSTSSCNQAKGHLYDPSAATSAGVTFSIPYLSGSAAGPIVWDSISIGGYTVDQQALAAVTDVQGEPLGPKFSGILGLALPLNSIIAADIPPVTSNNPDGAAWASNLFSINTAPSSPFISLALSRPGSDDIPAVLGIGLHPAGLIPNPSLIQYSTLVSNQPGDLFWKATVTAITVYVNGVANPIYLGLSNTGAAFPSAVLDSGTPLIFTTTTIANAIYGSIGIQPGSDGMYYVPCTTPLNMTITLDDRPEMPIHPLDLTAEPSQRTQFCTGLIQTADTQLSSPISSKADIILGVPFMRNVYTVMAYSTPNSNGTFTRGLSQTSITPRLGLLSLTDPTKALQEFHTVRVLNQPIGSSSSTTNSHGATTVNLGGKKVSVGIVVLIGLSSFIAFCGLLFAIRWFMFRHKHRKAAARQVHQAGDDDIGMDKVAYMLTRTSPSKKMDNDGLSEDELRRMKFDAYMRRERLLSDSTMSSDQTRVEVYDEVEGYEFGLRNPAKKVTVDDDEWDPTTALDWGDNTLTQPYPLTPSPVHLRTDDQELTGFHQRNSSLVMQPLLPAQTQQIDDHYHEAYTRYPSPNSSKKRRFQDVTTK